MFIGRRAKTLYEGNSPSVGGVAFKPKLPHGLLGRLQRIGKLRAEASGRMSGL